ncbi:MAG TPA: NUDIX hydrolase [Micromonosporaceae bacterium]|nr:NUDIX hydrolase [Micromonosporaceae bacterium]
MSVIRSAGGVIWRRDDPPADPLGPARIAIVHRDRYDDWSLPKGKLASDEHPLAAAVREVREETGATGLPGVRLPSTNYLTGEPDIEKVVDFWSMQESSPSTFVTNDEVDELRWVAPDEATGLLTYAHDRGVVAAFAAMPPVTGVAVLVRHAEAGSRAEWAAQPGPPSDDERPLDDIGIAQAHALASLLSLFQPVRVYSAPLVRCVDSVSEIGLPVRTDWVFAEQSDASPHVVADRLRALVSEYGRIIVSSQGGVIPATIAEFKPPNGLATDTYHTGKGASWVLSFSGNALVAADRLDL